MPASASVTIHTCPVEGNLFQPPDLEITHCRLVLQWTSLVWHPRHSKFEQREHPTAAKSSNLHLIPHGSLF